MTVSTAGAVAPQQLRPACRRESDAVELRAQQIHALVGRYDGNFRGKRLDLGGQQAHVLPGGKSIHLILVAIAPNHIQRIGSDGAGGT